MGFSRVMEVPLKIAGCLTCERENPPSIWNLEDDSRGLAIHDGNGFQQPSGCLTIIHSQQPSREWWKSNTPFNGCAWMFHFGGFTKTKQHYDYMKQKNEQWLWYDAPSGKREETSLEHSLCLPSVDQRTKGWMCPARHVVSPKIAGCLWQILSGCKKTRPYDYYII